MKTLPMALSAPAAALSLMLLAGCASGPYASGGDAQDAFFANLAELCGQTFEGKVVTDDPVDADFRSQRLVMHVRDCSDTEIRIPFHVGADHSRTWVITRTSGGLTLKHDHRDPDGTTPATGAATVTKRRQPTRAAFLQTCQQRRMHACRTTRTRMTWDCWDAAPQSSRCAPLCGGWPMRHTPS